MTYRNTVRQGQREKAVFAGAAYTGQKDRKRRPRKSRRQRPKTRADTVGNDRRPALHGNRDTGACQAYSSKAEETDRGRILCTASVIAVSVCVCMLGIQKGAERITKIMT